MSLATGPKTNFHSERAAGREQRLRFCQRERAGDTADGARSSRATASSSQPARNALPDSVRSAVARSSHRCQTVLAAAGSDRATTLRRPALPQDWSVIGPGCQSFLPHLLAFCGYRYRDSSQPPRSEYGLIYLQIGWFAARREPLMTGSEPPSIGVHCGANVARVPVIVAALFREGVTPEVGCLLYVRFHVKRGPGAAGAGRTVHCPATPSPFSHSHAGRAK